MKVVAADGFFESLGRLRPRFFRDKWYWLKCRLWHQYNVVRIRTLPPTWNDRTNVLPHAMFQVLTDFLERELTDPADDPVDEHWKPIIAELREHKEWWHNTYLPFDEFNGLDEAPVRDLLEMFSEPDERGMSTMLPFSPEESSYFETARERQEAIDKELTRRLTRLIELRDFLWT